MELPFVTVDVFTRTRFRGNPLAVVTIPGEGPKPSQKQKQLVAREFNLSETVFIHEPAPDAPAADQKRRTIDIFLTTAEIPFAGHPTIGAAVTLLPAGVRTLIAKAGAIDIVPTAEDAVQANIPHNIHLHARRLRDLISAAGASQPAPGVFSADADIRAAEEAAPIFSIVQGMTFVLVELPSLDALSRVTGAHIPGSELRDADWDHGFISKYFFVRTSPASSEPASPVSLRTRMMEPSFEDPATGSAASCLASYLALHGLPSKPSSPVEGTTRYDITQGVEMGKESNIVVEITVKDSQLQSVALEGAAVPVMRGTLTI